MKSEGSKPSTTNIRQDYNPGSLSEHAPATTPYPYEKNEHSKIVAAETGEVIRRKNNRIRDGRKRWAVVNAPQQTESK